MTPEEAQYLELGTTPGPWEAYDPGDGTARMYAGEGEEARPLLHNVDSDPHTACVYVTREDGNLIAAAPDMRATIAALRWEYAVEASDGDFLDLNDDAYSDVEVLWTWHRTVAEEVQAACGGTIVRRLGGPMEVVE